MDGEGLWEVPGLSPNEGRKLFILFIYIFLLQEILSLCLVSGKY